MRWREGDRNRSRSFRTRRDAELPKAAGVSSVGPIADVESTFQDDHQREGGE